MNIRIRIMLLTFFISYSAFSQNNTFYIRAWKQIDSLVNKSGQTRTALDEVNKVYQRASAEKNNAQLIKSLIYRINLSDNIRESEEMAGIKELEIAVSKSVQPAKSILQSLLAEKYYQAFQQLRWKLYNRTQTVDFKKDDINTWSAEDFHEKVASLYIQSISSEQVLKTTSLTAFDPVILKGNVRYLRPTLFDLLSHRALEYFSNDERNVNKPAYYFEITDAAAFSDPATFGQHHFKASDTASFEFQVLRLYQKLTIFHLSDKRPDALLDVNTSRIQYVYDHAVIENKDSLYLVALQKVMLTYGLSPITAQAGYLIAKYYADRASRYTDGIDTANRYGYLTAKEILNRIATQKENSEGKANAAALLSQILRKEIRLETEMVNIPGKPFRMLVHFKNIRQMHTKVIAIDPETKKQLRNDYWSDEYWKKILQMKSIRHDVQSLPDAADHQAHHVEIAVEALPPGEYALIASANENFTLINNPLAVQYFHISNLAYFNQNSEYYIRHRITGLPVGNVNVTVWKQQYNSREGKEILLKSTTIVADNKGHFILPVTTSYENRLLELSTPNDHLFLSEAAAFSRPQDGIVNDKETSHTFLFTDRAVFRPGQLVYFKGIQIRKPSGSTRSEIIAGLKSVVYLYDVNGRKIDSMEVTSNEFGSYSGKFNLPSGVLNGQFHLQDETTKGEVWFRVEEYKRPTYSVELKKPVQVFRVNDSVILRGEAGSYSGNKISGALVKYRVTRQTILPWTSYTFSRKIWPPYRRDNVEIAHGTTKTNVDGTFYISFKAIPDRTIDKKIQPVFHYMVSADVTDIAGETRSTSEMIGVAYQPYQINITAPNKIHTDSTPHIKVFSANLNGIHTKATVLLKVYKLVTPQRILRARYWRQPDTAIYSKEEYIKLFPSDIYMNEDNMDSWPRTLLFQLTDTTSVSGNFPMQITKWEPGIYSFEASSGDKNDSMFFKTYMNVFSKSNPGNPFAQAEIDFNKTSKIEGRLEFSICTNLDSVYALYDIRRQGMAPLRNEQRLSPVCSMLSVPLNITASTTIASVIVRDNRFYTSVKDSVPPLTENKLNITYATYRDKTLPGSEEKWSVNVSGSTVDQVTSELLMTMYDASLDPIALHKWNIPQTETTMYYEMPIWSGAGFQSQPSSDRNFDANPVKPFEKIYDRLVSWNNFYETNMTMQRNLRGGVVQMEAAKAAPPGIVSEEGDAAANGSAINDSVSDQSQKEQKLKKDQSAGIFRKNFNETAFFFPDLKTDAAGNVQFSFTMPEALTTWKWMTLAHNKQLAFGLQEKSIITQKPLMVQPNAPRFLREGDRMDFSVRLVNMSDREITGQVELQLIDPATNQSVDGWFRNIFPNQYFTIAAGASALAIFSIEVPFQYGKTLSYRVIARSDSVSDGEENIIPVVSNRVLVTESMPLPLTSGTAKHFTFDKLLKSGSSESLNHHSLTVEFTANPAWYAVQALPYLTENAYENAEQVFNRFYANALAAKIANESPRLKEVFEKWKIADTAALFSMLEKNLELKNILLQETPWVLQAKSETQQKKDVALLFEVAMMSREQLKTLNKLKALQNSSGAFSWFQGGPDDRFITQYILTGFGRLQKLQALSTDFKTTYESIITPAIRFADAKLKNDYDLLIRNKTNLANHSIGYIQLQYLYMRSYYLHIPVGGEFIKPYNFYRKQSQQFWLKENKFAQGMIALSLNRTGEKTVSRKIIESLRQNAIIHPELGMYWKENSGGYYWYQAPVETQALLIEAFDEVANDFKSVAELKTWLLKNKQTNNWKSTKATADACYALLLQGTELLTANPDISITLGNSQVSGKSEGTEAGTGYFKKTFAGNLVRPEMGDIQVFVKQNAVPTAPMPAWGAVYWQYFEDVDKVTSSATPLHIIKKVFVESNTDRGPILKLLGDGQSLKVGDKIKIRIELRADRDMEYVHMKDARASALEPLNEASGYRWQGGLGYYQSISDASTHFFFQFLNKGTYVFEYPLYVTHTGIFSNGIITIQSMYAPEYSSHSESIRLNIE
ncbi:MAG TPA: alpha-2-macroglobulin family protein [Flavitalea sp.]|nr:alpha-2-macroglobulin family protein [Flavitalea sp.]